MFCPKCGSILIPRKEAGKNVSVCSCGHKSSSEDAGEIKEKFEGKSSNMEVADTEDNLKAMPKMKAECPKCHNSEAYYWEVQTRASDEPATKFLKCTKCKRIWRDYN